MKRQAGRPAFFLRISEVAHRENLCYTSDITRTEDAMANFTKQAIKASFLKLLNQQPLNKISVRDIVDAHKGTVQPAPVPAIVASAARQLRETLPGEHGKFWKSSCPRIEGSRSGSY